MKEAGRSKWMVLAATVCIAVAPATPAAEDGHHPHHVGVLAGGLNLGSKYAFAYGVEYEYMLTPAFGIGPWLESAAGDFDLLSLGATGTFHVGDGLRLIIGSGYEWKNEAIKEKWLLRLSVGYNLAYGGWTAGPVVYTDLVENGTQLWLFGLSVGRGF